MVTQKIEGDSNVRSGGVSEARQAFNTATGSLDGDKEELNPIYLLEESNNCRGVLDSYPTMEDDDIEALDCLMISILKHPISFEAIVFSRLDKVVSALVDIKKGGLEINTTFEEVADKAVLVHRLWNKRFPSVSFDDARLHRMLRPGGLLYGVRLVASPDAASPVWTAKRLGRLDRGISAGGRKFNLGRWVSSYKNPAISADPVIIVGGLISPVLIVIAS